MPHCVTANTWLSIMTLDMPGDRVRPRLAPRPCGFHLPQHPTQPSFLLSYSAHLGEKHKMLPLFVLVFYPVWSMGQDSSSGSYPLLACLLLFPNHVVWKLRGWMLKRKKKIALNTQEFFHTSFWFWFLHKSKLWSSKISSYLYHVPVLSNFFLAEYGERYHGRGCGGGREPRWIFQNTILVQFRTTQDLSD